MKKLLCKRGETLTETLVAILVVALSAAMLAAMVTAAVNINLKANAAVDAFYAELSAAELGSVMPPAAGTVTVTITSTAHSAISGGTVGVTYYGADTNSLAAYEKAP